MDYNNININDLEKMIDEEIKNEAEKNENYI